MAFRCPHCGKAGISPLAKLIASATTWHGYPARCRLCGDLARLSGAATRAQFIVFVTALATIPWVFDPDDRLAAAWVTAAVLVAIGMLSPLKKKLL